MSALEQTSFVPVPVGVSDERLAARVAVDATAFTELHERYELPLLRYARSLLRDPHDAADAAQDAWTRAFAVLSGEPPLRILSVRSWLFAIARNACMDRLRDGRRCAPADIDERAMGASPGPDDVLELRDRAREALADLAGLSDRQRAAVVLRDINGLEGEELASALHTDSRRASWLLTDARRSLAEMRAGRGLTCEAARSALETSRIRTRAVRAHIAGCPECDGYARRRVGARVHLHAIALFVLALPARLRSLRSLGAVAAATVVAGVPVVQQLHHGPGARPHPHQAAKSAAPHHSSAPLRVVLPRPHRAAAARAEAAVVRTARPAAPPRPARVPQWRTATAPAADPAPARPAIVPAAAAPVPRVVEHVTSTVTTVAPATSPVVSTADGVLVQLGL